MYNVNFMFDNGKALYGSTIGLILDISPINGYNINTDTYTLPNGEGSAVSSTSIGGIDRTVRGILHLESHEDEAAAIQMNKILSCFAANSSGKVEISAYLPSGSGVSKRTVTSRFVVKKSAEIVDHAPGKLAFMAQIFCPSPYWVDGALTSKSIPISGFVYEYSGTAPAYIETIIQSSTVADARPGFKNETTGEYVYFDESVKIPTSGNVQIVYSKNKLKATRYDASTGVTDDITDKIIDFSQPVHLAIGNNTLLTGGVSTTIHYRTTYSGVSTW